MYKQKIYYRFVYLLLIGCRMAKKNSVGGYECGHCGSTDMQHTRSVTKGSGAGQFERYILLCNKCNNEDFYDCVPK
jgi:hypothetical protein